MSVAESIRAMVAEKEELAGYSGAKFGMWLFLITELMLFAVLFTAYGVFRTLHMEAFHHAHQELNLTLGTVNTAVLITSSFTMALAVGAAQRGRRGLATLFLSATLLFGMAFLFVKAVEYGAKIHHGLYPGGPAFQTLDAGGKLFFGLYFTMTGLHALHVYAGILVVFWLLVRNLLGHFSAEYYAPVEIGGLYWHLVDLIWIYLFPLLYLVG